MKLIILDRDGTINESREDDVKNVDEWVPIPGALEAIARLNQSGWQVVVATNQSGLGRGVFDMASLNAMHVKMNRMLVGMGGRVEAVFFCPHVPEDHCDCRIPMSGLLAGIAARFGMSLRGVPMAGGVVADLLAGAEAGCEPHLIGPGHRPAYAECQLEPGPAWTLAGSAHGIPVHADLAAFALHLLNWERVVRERPRPAAEPDALEMA